MKTPSINNRIVCVVDRENVRLAAVLSSYLSNPDGYFPLFTFPTINGEMRPESTIDDDDYISTIVGSETAVKVRNGIARLGKPEFVILAGLSEVQKTFLHWIDKTQIIEIASPSEVAAKLAEIGVTRNSQLRCKLSQIFVGLHIAHRNRQSILVDDDALYLNLPVPSRQGLIVLEQDFKCAETVVAVNYGHSIDADIAFVQELERDEPRQILDLMYRWRGGDGAVFKQIEEKVSQRVGSLDFTAYDFATFFTTGLPYSLVLKNQIPCTSVELSLRPDLFIVNCIVAENTQAFGSALVFCHDDFLGSDEIESEAQWLIERLNEQEAIVRVLAGSKAMVHNLDYNVQHFPYDLLHIASHGGLMSGQAVVQNFTDRDGNPHTVEYDEVVSFKVRPGRRKIGVSPFRIFKKFDGFVWRSKELASLNLPSYVFLDMNKAMTTWKDRTQTSKEDVPASRAIVCNDSFHQGTFRSLAAYTSPIIFNNACWSWSDIGSFFLSAGARGYVGTYWDILNTCAVDGAKAFYQSLGEPVMMAVYRANAAVRASDDANIFMYWGLHFSVLHAGSSRERNFGQVLHAIVDELFIYIDSVPSLASIEVRTNTFDAIRMIRRDIQKEFPIANRAELESEIAIRLSNAIRQLRARMRVDRLNRKAVS